jgi:ABC-type oligopeptide transport system substrate-binding subunit
VRPTWAPRPYLPDPPAISSEICRQLRSAGFNVTEQPSPSTEEYARLKSSGDFDVLVAGWIADDTIPTTFYMDNLSSAKVGSTNIPRYRSPSVDSLLGRMKVLTGPALMQACEEVEEIVLRDVPLVPLFHGPQMAAAAERVVGRILHPASALRVWNLSFSGTGQSRLTTGSLRSPFARPS